MLDKAVLLRPCGCSARPRHTLKPKILLCVSGLSLLRRGAWTTSCGSASLPPPRLILPPNVGPRSPLHVTPTPAVALLWSDCPRILGKVLPSGSEGLRTSTVPRSAHRYNAISGEAGPSQGLCFWLGKGRGGGGGLWLPPPAVPQKPPEGRIWDSSLPFIPLSAIQFKRPSQWGGET